MLHTFAIWIVKPQLPLCDADGGNIGGRRENRVVLVFGGGSTEYGSPVAATNFKEGEEACGGGLRNKALIAELSISAPDSDDLLFPSKYSRPLSLNARLCYGNSIGLAGGIRGTMD
ncbi:hypothetical protein KIW84_031891 [Lathyrus oleraceus]|uniref:Uncharacterized protein n=1 Tax=Pisum sativum TaxID=3888 RepID=A0A9D5B1G7_PEA|nr:hypothetical protein KIW84_031891 [Pisum sativum]